MGGLVIWIVVINVQTIANRKNGGTGMRMKTMEHGTPTKEYKFVVKTQYHKIADVTSTIYTFQSTDHTEFIFRF